MKTIMVVDDSAFTRSIHKGIVEALGHQVVEADNGRQAITLFKEEKPDLVLIDLLMPDIDGMDAAREILALDQDARIVICSTDKQAYRRKEAKEIGVVDFVAKPVDPQALTRVIKEFCDTV